MGPDGSYLIDLLPANVCKQNVTRFPHVHRFSLKNFYLSLGLQPDSRSAHYLIDLPMISSLYSCILYKEQMFITRGLP